MTAITNKLLKGRNENVCVDKFRAGVSWQHLRMISMMMEQLYNMLMIDIRLGCIDTQNIVAIIQVEIRAATGNFSMDLFNQAVRLFAVGNVRAEYFDHSSRN